MADLDRFDLTQEFLPWACGVARNMVRNFLRRRGRIGWC